MAVDISQLSSASRDAYWLETQAELKSAKQRGDNLSFIALGLIAALLTYYGAPGDNVDASAVGIAIAAMAAVALPQLFAARHKRRISAARGMNCRHCGYVPHQTEISEVARTRECRRCEKPLGSV